MLSYFNGSLIDLFHKSERDVTIIVPITDTGFIQNPSIRTLAAEYPEILCKISTYCTGFKDGLIRHYLDPHLSSQLVFIECISTKNGMCELKTDIYLDLLDHVISILTITDTELPTTYLIEPMISSGAIYEATIESIMEISTKHRVSLNYVLPSTIL